MDRAHICSVNVKMCILLHGLGSACAEPRKGVGWDWFLGSVCKTLEQGGAALSSSDALAQPSTACLLIQLRELPRRLNPGRLPEEEC